MRMGEQESRRRRRAPPSACLHSTQQKWVLIVADSSASSIFRAKIRHAAHPLRKINMCRNERSTNGTAALDYRTAFFVL